MTEAPPPFPVLYSFRRCPYAMRARMALWIAGETVELREVKLAEKPPELIEASAKATVPVLVLPDGLVIDESIAIMRWALHRSDPEGWLSGDDADLIAEADGPFKHALDRYKYPVRYPDENDGDEKAFGQHHRAKGLAILEDWNERLGQTSQLCGDGRTLADIALFPFVRQFANHDRNWFDALDLPHLQRWLEGHLASDLFASIMPKFTPWKSGDAPLRQSR
ncbi:glutathione S-transferase [Erythrobacter sp. KY5]|uniref:glutathione S-transferase n=1 Tax=Erythrobacter sp. KY5 TaxID=2011159 RepID=UPI000DBF12EF|nr:glutathione S-transferase [Erythrobacter sp. KY5]AWW75193.1 glutathione S-transferase [Erythrobacter sp. KY5]